MTRKESGTLFSPVRGREVMKRGEEKDNGFSGNGKFSKGHKGG